MSIPPIVSAIAVALAAWLIFTMIYVAVTPADQTPTTPVALLSYVVAIAAGVLTYRARMRSK